MFEEYNTCKFIFNVHPVWITLDIDFVAAGKIKY